MTLLDYLFIILLQGIHGAALTLPTFPDVHILESGTKIPIPLQNTEQNRMKPHPQRSIQPPYWLQIQQILIHARPRYRRDEGIRQTMVETDPTPTLDFAIASGTRTLAYTKRRLTKWTGQK